MAKVTVGCRLPNGISLDHPTDLNKKITLAGSNKERIAGSGYGLTEVEKDLWDAVEASHKGLSFFVNGSIFVAKNAADAEIAVREVAKESTGFEKIRQDADGVKKSAEE